MDSHSHRLFVPLLALLILGPGCGSKSSGGGNIVGSSGTLTINAPSDVIKCGACQPFTATYTKGGSSQTVTPTWSTDNAAIATIDATGQLTAVSHGNVTVNATYQDARASKPVRIVADYGTTWAGHYMITRCEATDDWRSAGFCDDEGFTAGQTLEIGLDFQQERDAVSGTMWLGALNGSFTGTVASAGNLTGECKMAFSVEGIVADTLVSPFSVLRQGDRITEGNFTVTMTTAQMHGHGVFDARVMGLDKYTGGRAAIRKETRPPRTLRGVWQMIRGR